MMRQGADPAVSRGRLEDPDKDRGTWPDLVLIDGGQGQLAWRWRSSPIPASTMSPWRRSPKGRTANAGRERFFLPGKPAFSLTPRTRCSYYLQRLRDESTASSSVPIRAKRSKQIVQSVLDEVAGSALKRKNSAAACISARPAPSAGGIADLCAVPAYQRRWRRITTTSTAAEALISNPLSRSSASGSAVTTSTGGGRFLARPDNRPS